LPRRCCCAGWQWIGPAGLGLVSDRDKIEIVAEVGVMLLLFMVGLKISLRDLWRMRATVLGGGGLQYGATALATSLLARTFGLPWPEAIAWGLAVGLSSTALVIWSSPSCSHCRSWQAGAVRRAMWSSSPSSRWRWWQGSSSRPASSCHGCARASSPPAAVSSSRFPSS
jgi:hypothetical protein